MNKALIIGHLGADPDMRYTASGDPVCNISVATTERWRDRNTGEQREATEWHRVSAFGRLAEIMGEYLRTGSLVFIEGKLQTRKYDDRQGITRYSTEIVAREMEMLGGRSDGGARQQNLGYEQSYADQKGRVPQQPATPRTPPQAPFHNDDFDDDIPF